MGGVFDRLHDEISGDEEESGLSILDLVDLPPSQRKIMRMMLREVQMSEQELRQAVEAWPEAERMSQQELDEALELLSRNLWLIRTGEEHVSYRANLRRKAKSKLNIWGSLEDKIAQSASQPPEDE